MDDFSSVVSESRKNLLRICQKYTKLQIIPFKIEMAPDFKNIGRGLPKEHPHKIETNAVH